MNVSRVSQAQKFYITHRVAGKGTSIYLNFIPFKTVVGGVLQELLYSVHGQS